jgi:hypothetical protein
MKSFTRPEKGTYPDVDAAVLHFDKEAHAEGKPIKWWAVQVKATETAESLGINVKAGRGACYRFVGCEGLSLRDQTSICQEITADFQEKLVIKEEAKLCLRIYEMHTRQWCILI